MGVGAILGAPFMLSTLAMFVTGIAIVIFARRERRGTDMRVNIRVLGRDVAFFFVGYGIAIGTAFLPTGLELAQVGRGGGPRGALRGLRAGSTSPMSPRRAIPRRWPGCT